MSNTMNWFDVERHVRKRVRPHELRDSIDGRNRLGKGGRKIPVQTALIVSGVVPWTDPNLDTFKGTILDAAAAGAGRLEGRQRAGEAGVAAGIADGTLAIERQDGHVKAVEDEIGWGLDEGTITAEAGDWVEDRRVHEAALGRDVEGFIPVAMISGCQEDSKEGDDGCCEMTGRKKVR